MYFLIKISNNKLYNFVTILCKIQKEFTSFQLCIIYDYLWLLLLLLLLLYNI
jgi:hypothetical protein